MARVNFAILVLIETVAKEESENKWDFFRILANGPLRNPEYPKCCAVRQRRRNSHCFSSPEMRIGSVGPISPRASAYSAHAAIRSAIGSGASMCRK